MPDPVEFPVAPVIRAFTVTKNEPDADHLYTVLWFYRAYNGRDAVDVVIPLDLDDEDFPVGYLSTTLPAQVESEYLDLGYTY